MWYVVVISGAILLGLLTYLVRPRPLSNLRVVILVVLAFGATALVLVMHELENVFPDLSGVSFGVVH